MGGPANEDLLRAIGRLPGTLPSARSSGNGGPGRAFDLDRGGPGGSDSSCVNGPSAKTPASLFTAFSERKGGTAALAKALAGQTLPEDVAKIGIRTVRAAAATLRTWSRP